MTGIEDLLKRLLGLRDEHARAVLERPTERSEFGYGEASGRYKGLQLAIQEVERAIEENDDEALGKENDL